MPIRARKSFRVGPFRFHFTQAGYQSWSVKVGWWSWNSRGKRHRVDLPGPIAWVSPKRNSRPL